MDLINDEGVLSRTQKASQLTWDRKKKKFIQGDGAGADNQKIIRTESGARLPISYKSGRFEEWKQKKRVTLPKIGEAEGDLAGRVGGMGDKRYRHNKITDAKPLDVKSTTYERKSYALKKRAEAEAAAEGGGDGLVKTKKGKVVKGVRAGTANTRSELKSVQEIRKQRQILEQVSLSGIMVLAGWLICFRVATGKECEAFEEGWEGCWKGQGEAIRAGGVWELYLFLRCICYVQSAIQSILEWEVSLLSRSND